MLLSWGLFWFKILIGTRHRDRIVLGDDEVLIHVTLYFILWLSFREDLWLFVSQEYLSFLGG